MWKRGLHLQLLLVIILALTGCSRPEAAQFELGKEFSLSTGQQVLIIGEDLKITFLEVAEDSRCPRDVTCVWAGRVTCKVESSRVDVTEQIDLTAPGLTDDYTVARHKDYTFAFRVIPYPQAGKEIPDDEYRLNMIVSKVTEPTKIIGSILADPSVFQGQKITIVGYYRGWDLLHEANVAPPVTRSDWVIKDSTGAIYINANSKAKAPEGLNPASLPDTDVLLLVTGIVHVTKAGQPYIEATNIERVY